jgi:gliding motility-associated lipoprotein GldD
MNKIRSILVTSIVLSLFFFFLFTSCGSDEEEVISPKPHGYFRIDFPKKEYKNYSGDCPFSFDIPVYANIKVDNDANAEPCWLFLDFPAFKARLHLTYKAVNGNIDKYLEQTYDMASRHQIKASGIEEMQVSKKATNVYGLIYNIEGNAASSTQFFLTDSVHHFIRGALYFYEAPNADSTKPVVDFIRKDIQHLIESFKWENKAIPSFSPKASK